MNSKPFFAVLTEQMRTDLEREIREEWQRRHGPSTKSTGGAPKENSTFASEQLSERLFGWLATHLPKPKVSAVKNAYGMNSKGPNTKNENVKNPVSERSVPLPSDHDFATAAGQDNGQTGFQFEAETVEQLGALEVLRRNGGSLGDRFTENELKKAWRKAALRTHPDRFEDQSLVRQAEMNAAFQQIAAAYELLAFGLHRAQAAFN